MAFKKAGFCWLLPAELLGDCSVEHSLSTESVEGLALSLESVDNVHSDHGLPLGVLSVGDCISDHRLEVVLENASGLFVDQSTDSLHTSSSCQSSDSRLGDTLDVVTQDLSMTLGSSLSESFSSFASSRHDSVDVIAVDVL